MQPRGRELADFVLKSDLWIRDAPDHRRSDSNGLKIAPGRRPGAGFEPFPERRSIGVVWGRKAAAAATE